MARPHRETIALTGFGLISALGDDPKKVFARLLARESAIARISSFDSSSLPFHCAAQIAELPEIEPVGPGVRFLDRYVRLTLGSVQRALQSRGAQISGDERSRIGVVFGGWMPQMNSLQEFIETYDRDGVSAVSPMSFPNCAFNAAACQTGIRFKLRAFNATLSAGATTGLVALEHACQQIADGVADQVLVSGVQELIPVVLAGYAANGMLAQGGPGNTERCSPFDRTRSGTVLGEAACTLLVESAEHARRGGSRVLAELSKPYTGFIPEACRPHVKNQSGAEHLSEILKRALELGHLRADALDYVSAAANGCPWGDAFEARALRAVISDRTLVASIKGGLGELVGVAPLVQVGMTALSFSEDIVPPTLNYQSSEEGCELSGLSGEPQRREVRTALVNSVCWSGCAGSIVMRRADA